MANKNKNGKKNTASENLSEAVKDNKVFDNDSVNSQADFEQKENKEKKPKNPNPYKAAKKAKKTSDFSKPDDDKKKKKGEGKNAIVKFFKDVKSEGKKVVWSKGKDTMKNTGIVMLLILVIGVFVWILDFVLSKGLGVFYNLAEKQQSAMILFNWFSSLL